MDVIRFERRYDACERRDVVDVFVNGRPFIEQIAAYERQFIAAEDRADAAGDYVGLPLRSTAPPSRVLLGEPDGWFCSHPGIVSMLTCTCGELGCGSVNCFIAVNDERVVWSAFRGALGPVGDNGRRKRSYDGFGPFEFDRSQYENALAALASAPTP